MFGRLFILACEWSILINRCHLKLVYPVRRLYRITRSLRILQVQYLPKEALTVLGFGCPAPNPESGHLSGTFCQLRTVSQLPGIRLCATPGDVPLLRLAPPAQNLRSAIHLEPGNCVTQQWHRHKQVRGSEVYRWSLICASRRTHMFLQFRWKTAHMPLGSSRMGFHHMDQK